MEIFYEKARLFETRSQKASRDYMYGIKYYWQGI